MQNEKGTSSPTFKSKGPQAKNKEEIMYKLMVGDTTNTKTSENAWFFHTPNPDTDVGTELNPHFDSLEGLEEEDAFDEGLDCVFIMSCGPFDLKVGEEVPFSFCIIFGQNKQDLISNAKFAQIMYNSHYQGYTPPTRPDVHAVTDHNKVSLFWDNAAEISNDIVTGYADFEKVKMAVVLGARPINKFMMIMESPLDGSLMHSLI